MGLLSEIVNHKSGNDGIFFMGPEPSDRNAALARFVAFAALAEHLVHGNSIPRGTNREQTTNPKHAPKPKQVIRMAVSILYPPNQLDSRYRIKIETDVNPC